MKINLFPLQKGKNYPIDPILIETNAKESWNSRHQ